MDVLTEGKHIQSETKVGAGKPEDPYRQSESMEESISEGLEIFHELINRNRHVKRMMAKELSRLGLSENVVMRILNLASEDLKGPEEDPIPF